MILVFMSCSNNARGTGNNTEDQERGNRSDAAEEVKSLDDYIRELKNLKPMLPIANSHVATFDGQLPNAPRKYRNGYHEGFDFYDGFCGVEIENGTPVQAIADGEVMRADTLYVEIETEKRSTLLEEAKERGFTSAATLDILRGRQVWIDHGEGIVTRYCHLSGIQHGLKGPVLKGDTLGFVGGSGTKSKTPHLHFEICFGDDFFGKGMKPDEIRALMAEVFVPVTVSE